MADVSCSRVVRLKNHVDYDYLSSNFYVWEGTYGRIANTYIYNRTSKGISVVDTPGTESRPHTKNLTFIVKQLNVIDNDRNCSHSVFFIF